MILLLPVRESSEMAYDRYVKLQKQTEEAQQRYQQLGKLARVKRDAYSKVLKSRTGEDAVEKREWERAEQAHIAAFREMQKSWDAQQEAWMIANFPPLLPHLSAGPLPMSRRPSPSSSPWPRSAHSSA